MAQKSDDVSFSPGASPESSLGVTTTTSGDTNPKEPARKLQRTAAAAPAVPASPEVQKAVESPVVDLTGDSPDDVHSVISSCKSDFAQAREILRKRRQVAASRMQMQQLEYQH